MAYVHFDSSYTPCGFLIVKDGGNPYNDSDIVLIQTDWDFPGVASRIGWIPCECGATDGTIDCPHKKASEMIASAYDYLWEHDGENYESLDDYFQED